MAAFALLLTIALWDPDLEVMFYGGFTLVGVATGIVVVALATGGGGLSRALKWRPLREIGKVSYGLYLWHLPCLVLVNRSLDGFSRPIRALVGLLLTAAATQVSWL